MINSHLFAQRLAIRGHAMPENHKPPAFQPALAVQSTHNACGKHAAKPVGDGVSTVHNGYSHRNFGRLVP